MKTTIGCSGNFKNDNIEPIVEYSPNFDQSLATIPVAFHFISKPITTQEMYVKKTTAYTCVLIIFNQLNPFEFKNTMVEITSKKKCVIKYNWLRKIYCHHSMFPTLETHENEGLPIPSVLICP